VASVVGLYQADVQLRGLQQLGDEDTLDIVVQEQCALITGTLWTFALEILPWFHHTYKVIDIEREDVAVLGCTCGLGDLVGTKDLHEARDCQGVGWMCRGDIIAEHRAAGTLAYFEIKTSSYPTRAEDWETKIQFAAAVLGAEARLERPIDESWVLNLLVGKREGAYDYETKKKDGPVRQQSIYCYGYKKAPQAPGMVEEWAAEYSYQDEHGRNRKLTKDYQKAGVWTMDPRLTGGVDPAEYWVRWLPAGLRQQQFAILGPLNRQTKVLDGFKQELVSEERRWQTVVWAVYDLQQQGYGWGTPEMAALLNELVPRSWACNRFGSRYGCQFKALCFEREGWTDPLGAGGYQLRRPHHEPEVEQAVARGVELPAEAGEGEEL
jgi:hypothetical protein